jgi:WD40 repeat protein
MNNVQVVSHVLNGGHLKVSNISSEMYTLTHKSINCDALKIKIKLFFRDELIANCFKFEDEKRPSFVEIQKLLNDHYDKLNDENTKPSKIKLELRLTLLEKCLLKIKKHKWTILIGIMFILIALFALLYVEPFTKNKHANASTSTSALLTYQNNETQNTRLSYLKTSSFSQKTDSYLYKTLTGDIGYPYFPESGYAELKKNTEAEWSILPKLTKTLTGHIDAVKSLMMLKDGNIASGSSDRTVKIWNVKEGSVNRTLTGHIGAVSSLVLLRNGNIASASHDKTVKIWNLTDGSLIRTLTGHFDGINSIVLLQDGNIASASHDKTVKIWNLRDGSEIRTLIGHRGWVFSLVLLQDGSIASGAWYGEIKVWNVTDGRVIRQLTGHTEVIFSLVLLQDGSMASASGDTTIKIWNIRDGTVIKTLKGHQHYVRALIPLKDGSIASGSENEIIKIWNVTDGSVIRTLTDHAKTIFTLLLLQDGNIASGGYDATIKIWDIRKILNTKSTAFH